MGTVFKSRKCNSSVFQCLILKVADNWKMVLFVLVQNVFFSRATCS